MAERSAAMAVIQRLNNQTLDRDLSIDELNQLLNAFNEHLLPKSDVPVRVLIVDNCGPRQDWTTRIVKREFNKLYRQDGAAQAYIYGSSDIPGTELWINQEIKFRLLADFATVLLVIDEPQTAQPLPTWESVLASTPSHQEKAIVLKHAYSHEMRPQRYHNLRKTVGDSDQLFIWESIADLAKICCNIYKTVPELQGKRNASSTE